MPEPAPTGFSDLWSADRELQNEAFSRLPATTHSRVGWAHEVWSEVVGNLTHEDNHKKYSGVWRSA